MNNQKIYINDFGFDELETGSIYSKWIYSIIKSYIQNKILEVGSGIGTMVKNYGRKKIIIASDIKKEYLKIIKQRYKLKNNLKIIHLDITKINKKQLNLLKSQHIDTIIAINVLEHIKNDQKAIANIYKILIRNGRIILFLPTCPKIYGSLDKAFHHYRRYSKKEIIDKLIKENFHIEFVKYFNLTGIIWWFIAGKILKLKKLPNTTGKLLNFVIPFLQKLESVISPPLGQSIVVIAKKII